MSQLNLHKAIAQAIEQSIGTIVDEQIKIAQDEVEKRMKARVGQITATVARMMDYQHFNDRLVITVRFPENT